jgi:hypothetical protein
MPRLQDHLYLLFPLDPSTGTRVDHMTAALRVAVVNGASTVLTGHGLIDEFSVWIFESKTTAIAAGKKRKSPHDFPPSWRRRG